jgi:hypothetical protein
MIALIQVNAFYDSSIFCFQIICLSFNFASPTRFFHDCSSLRVDLHSHLQRVRSPGQGTRGQIMQADTRQQGIQVEDIPSCPEVSTLS